MTKITAASVPSYFINLARRPDRRAFFQAQCQRLGLAACRIEAVTPEDLSVEEVSRLATGTRGRPVRPIEFACIKSHLRAWEQFLLSDAAIGAFFEDDALLSDSLPDFFADCAKANSWGFDLIRLDQARRVRLFPARHESAHGIALREFRSTLHGTAGYILTREAAQRLLAYPGWGRTQFDLALYDPFRAPGNLVSRALIEPALCVQFASRADMRKNEGIGRSDIDPPRQTGEPAKIVSPERQVSRALSSMVLGVRNAVDHLRLLGKGLETGRVGFKGDSPYMDEGPSEKAPQAESTKRSA